MFTVSQFGVTIYLTSDMSSTWGKGDSFVGNVEKDGVVLCFCVVDAVFVYVHQTNLIWRVRI